MQRHVLWLATLILARFSTFACADEPKLARPEEDQQVPIALRAAGELFFTPDGKTLITSWGTTVEIWDFQKRKFQKSLRGHRDSILYLAVTRDRKTVAAASQNRILLWDMASDKITLEIKRTPSGLRDISFSPDGKILATSHLDAKVRLWDVAKGEEQAFRVGHKDQLYQVRFSPDGKLLASASNDQTINVWDDKGALLMTLPGHADGSLSLAFSPDNNMLASGGWDHSLKLWNVKTGKQQALLGRHDDRIQAVAFSPNGKTLASCGGNDIKLWDVATFKEQTTLKGHQRAVMGIAFTPDGKRLVSSGYGGEVRVWDLPVPKKPKK